MRAASAPEERARWRRLKQFPTLLVIGPDGLTLEQELAIEVHQLLDDGRVICPHCDELVPDADFCGHCGEEVRPGRKQRRCPDADCPTITTLRWCPSCGTLVITELAEKFDRGEVTKADLIDQAMRRLRGEG